MPRFRRLEKITETLEATYPDADCELDFSNPLQLLVATILSAQSTDKRVNLVTPALFKKYKTVRAFARAEPGGLEEMILATVNLKQQARFEKVFDYRRWRRGRLASASRLIADEFNALAEQAEA